MNTAEITENLAQKLVERKARDVAVINIKGKSSFADYFINATAGSERQLAALSDYAEEIAIDLGLEVKSTTGKNSKGWILIDCGDVILNIFTESMRDKYNLEKLWADCGIEYLG